MVVLDPWVTCFAAPPVMLARGSFGYWANENGLVLFSYQHWKPVGQVCELTAKVRFQVSSMWLPEVSAVLGFRPNSFSTKSLTRPFVAYRFGFAVDG